MAGGGHRRGRLTGKVTLITGTARGQGRAAAMLFADEGATVVGCDVDEEGAQTTVEMVRGQGGAMTSAQPVDLGDPEACRAWIDGAAAEHDGFDVLYNNASSPRFAPIAEMSDEVWHWTIRNELDLVFYACRAAWPHLEARGGGSIINTASIAGLTATGYLARGSGAHAATKGAVLALTRELAFEGAPHNIRANSISPGPIDTPAIAPIIADPSVRDAVLAAPLLHRLGTSEDVVAAALFLASDESAWVTGTDITVDGGCTAR